MTSSFRRNSLSSMWGSISRPLSPTARENGSLKHPQSPDSRRARQAAIHQHELAGVGHEDAVLLEFKKMIEEAGVRLSPEMVINSDLDATLRRFLRARKYRLGAAFAMLEKSLGWRDRVGADDALRKPLRPDLVKVIRECRPSSYIGFHRDGFPIFVERLGMLDATRIEKEHLSEEQLLMYHLREMEFMGQVVFAEAARRTGRTIDRVVTIMDAAGLTFSMLTGFAQRLFRALTAMDSDNYPETCHHIFIVNNSTAFSAIWRVVKVFVDVGTRDKVKVLGSGNPMLASLLQEFDASQVPSFLGGALDYDDRRRQWLDMMDAAMAHAAALSGGGAKDTAPSASGVHGHHAGPLLNGLERPQLPALRTSVAASLQSSDMEDADGFATPGSTASRVSSAMSVYFDALEGSSPSVTRPNGAPAGASPCGSPRSALRSGSFDTQLPPNYQPQHRHHIHHQESKLAAVPSGDLSGGEGPQPRCCVIS